MRKFLFLFFATLFAARSLLGFDGFYLGGMAGGAATTVNQEGNAIATFTSTSTNLFPIFFNAESFGENALVEFYGGWGYQCHCFYGGVEFFGKYSPGKAVIDRHNVNLFPGEFAEESSFGQTVIETGPWHWGIQVRGGFLVSPLTLLYGRVGFDRATLEIRSNGRVSGALSLTLPFDVSLENTKRTKKVAFQAGMGIEQHLSKHVTLRADYGYTDFRKISISNAITRVVPPNTFTFSNTKDCHVYNHEFKLGLSYYFQHCTKLDGYQLCSFLPNFCGWYAGAGVGDSLMVVRHHFDFHTVSPGVETGDPGIHVARFDVKASKYHFKGFFYGGYSFQYGFLVPNLFSALELFASVSPAKEREGEMQLFFSGFVPARFSVLSVTKFHTEIDPFQCGIQARSGLLVTPLTTIYGTVGTSIARIHAKSRTVLRNVVTGFTLNQRISKSNTRFTLQLGAGIEHDLGHRFHLRGDYFHTDYGTLNLEDFTSGFAGDNGTNTITNDTRVHIRDHNVLISLNRYW